MERKRKMSELLPSLIFDHFEQLRLEFIYCGGKINTKKFKEHS